MLRVSEADIRAGDPVGFDVYSAKGALLLSKGQEVIEPEHVEILRAQGWKMVDGDAEPPEGAMTPEQAASATLPTQVKFRQQPLPPLGEAAALVADDARMIRELLVLMLREAGVSKVDVVDNGRKAVSYVFRYRPHLVFLDIDMPLIDGLAALQQIKGWSDQIFVCMVSGNCTLLNVREAQSQGVDGFLAKPLTALNLRRVLALYEKRRVKDAASPA